MSDINNDKLKLPALPGGSEKRTKPKTINPIIKDEIVLNVPETRAKHVKESKGIEYNSIGDGIIITDLNLNIRSINDSAVNLTGWKEDRITGKPFEEFFKIIKKSNRAACGVMIDSDENYINRLNNCTVVSRNSTGNSMRVSALPIQNEIGEIKEIMLVLKNQYTAKGHGINEYYKYKHDNFVTITKGLLHDLNNYFTPLLANLSLLKMNAEAGDDNYERILQCEMSCIKAIDFMQKFSLISETSNLKKEVESISDIVRSSVDLILSGTNIKCEYEIDDNLKPVEVDKNKIVQSLYNILKIYRENIAEGGTLNVSIQNFSTEDNEFLPLDDREYVRITIEDKSNQVNFKSIEFNTDHEVNSKENTAALGLTLSFNIIKEHGGLFDFDNLDNHTKVFIYLPSFEDDLLFLEEDGLYEEVAEETPSTEKEKSNILIMDDNEMVAGTLGEMLTRLGCSVHITHSGEDALKINSEANTKNQSFDIAFLDLTIPGGMGAEDIIKSMKAINPETKVVVISGSANHPVMQNFKDYGFDSFIIKPFDFSELRSVIDGLTE